MLVVKKCQNSLGISVYYGQCGNLTLEVVDTLSVVTDSSIFSQGTSRILIFEGNFNQYNN